MRSFDDLTPGGPLAIEDDPEVVVALMSLDVRNEAARSAVPRLPTPGSKSCRLIRLMQGLRAAGVGNQKERNSAMSIRLRGFPLWLGMPLIA